MSLSAIGRSLNAQRKEMEAAGWFDKDPRDEEAEECAKIADEIAAMVDFDQQIAAGRIAKMIRKRIVARQQPTSPPSS